MIKTTKTFKGVPKIVFRGSEAEIREDIKRIMWSMIQKNDKTRNALIDAIQSINDAVKMIENSQGGKE